MYAIRSYYVLFLSTSCSKSEEEDTEEVPAGVDTTTTCRSVVESGGYSTFYKPQSGYVGDPMPYFNSDDDKFYLFYLQDWRNGATTEHPIYCTTTSDYGTFSGFTQAIPTETRITSYNVCYTKLLRFYKSVTVNLSDLNNITQSLFNISATVPINRQRM